MNYFFQKRITKSIPLSDRKFQNKVNVGIRHHENFLKYNQLSEPGNKYYEFGAGWEFIVPLTIAHLGFESNIIDIRKLMKFELINDTINRLNTNKFLPIDISEKPNVRTLAELEEFYKVSYEAPADARNTRFSDNYFDFSSSSVTMEHIPPDDILAILNETYRILKPGGILSMTTDYQDHWSYFDHSISVYNYLKYSPQQWAKYNPSLHYQNRLRHSDYLKIISETKFKIAKENKRYPKEELEEKLKSIQLANMYRDYDFDDLKILGSEIVLVK